MMGQDLLLVTLQQIIIFIIAYYWYKLYQDEGRGMIER